MTPIAGRRTRRYDQGKRAIDIVVALVGMVLTAPLQAVIAVLVARALGRPVLFCQQRPGKDGKPFTLIKFRTMVNADPKRGLITDAERLVSFGATLRSTSLDELPTLWNVIRGDMSLVGPRPLLLRYLPHMTERERTRHLVRPGITGLAQVSGRNFTPWDQRLALDVEYVDHRSARLDLRIIVQTISQVIRRRDIATDPQSVMLDLDQERPPS